jgi:hypothetical protein
MKGVVEFEFASMPHRAAARVESRAKTPAPASLPQWFRPLLAALAGVVFIGMFSTEAYDSDFWWHLKTGQFLWQQHRLPAPDPFAYTTANAPTAYQGELVTRYFNLTHEWLAQLGIYLAYALGGIPGVILFRAALLTIFCGLVGLVSYRRCDSFLGSLGAAGAAAVVAIPFAQDRPFLITFLCAAAMLLLLDNRRWLWLLPLIMMVWANAHGGYVLGWALLAAYCAEDLLLGRPDRRLLWIAPAAILISVLNPNGFQVVRVLVYYRRSFLTSTLLEWAPPALWPPRPFVWLLVCGSAALLWRHAKVRPVDWMLFVFFGAASLAAERNVVFAGMMAPIVIVSYLPWNRPSPRWLAYAAAGVLVAVIAWGLAAGRFLQLRAAEWRFPAGAVDFLLAHHIDGPIFNSYEYGGYLIWRLWPPQRVFIDGRALSESVFRDYGRILYNHDESGGKSAAQLLDQYGVEVIVMNGFEYATGTLYKLAPGLADPRDPAWHLVYSDPQAVIFMRRPPQGVQPLDKLSVFDHLEAECDLHIRQEPVYPRCARSLAQAFTTIHDWTRARRWLGIYLARPHAPDVEAQRAYQQLLASGH